MKHNHFLTLPLWSFFSKLFPKYIWWSFSECTMVIIFWCWSFSTLLNYALFNVHDFLFKKFQVTTYMFVKDKDQLPYKLGRDFLIQCPGLSLQAPKSQYYVEKKGESYFVMWDFLLFIWNNYLFNKKYLTACEFYYCL